MLNSEEQQVDYAVEAAKNAKSPQLKNYGSTYYDLHLDSSAKPRQDAEKMLLSLEQRSRRGESGLTVFEPMDLRNTSMAYGRATTPEGDIYDTVIFKREMPDGTLKIVAKFPQLLWDLRRENANQATPGIRETWMPAINSDGREIGIMPVYESSPENSQQLNQPVMKDINTEQAGIDIKAKARELEPLQKYAQDHYRSGVTDEEKNMLYHTPNEGTISTEGYIPQLFIITYRSKSGTEVIEPIVRFVSKYSQPGNEQLLMSPNHPNIPFGVSAYSWIAAFHVPGEYSSDRSKTEVRQIASKLKYDGGELTAASHVQIIDIPYETGGKVASQFIQFAEKRELLHKP